MFFYRLNSSFLCPSQSLILRPSFNLGLYSATIEVRPLLAWFCSSFHFLSTNYQYTRCAQSIIGPASRNLKMAQLETHHGYYLWRYVPSLAAAVLFALLFAAATAAHFWRVFRTRALFCLPFAFGGLLEFIGYAARAAAHSHTGKLMPFVIQNSYILLGPALFAASIYMTLGRIIRCVEGELHSIIRVNWLTKAFIFGDVLSFVIQGSAAGLMVSGKNAKLGEVVVLLGLFIQIISFGLFAVTAIIFQARMQRFPTAESYTVDLPWRQTL